MQVANQRQVKVKGQMRARLTVGSVQAPDPAAGSDRRPVEMREGGREEENRGRIRPPELGPGGRIHPNFN